MFRYQLLTLISYSLLIPLTMMSLPAGSATFTVTSLNDSGPGSLRQAVLDANATLGADTIEFQTGLTGTITLASTYEITDSLTINGPGASQLAISGNDITQIFYIKSIEQYSFDIVAINNLTLRNGKGAIVSDDYAGGAIYNYDASLTLNYCILSDSRANNGGAIFNESGWLTVNNSTLLSNLGFNGGAIYNNVNGKLTVNSSTLSGNETHGGLGSGGGGILNRGTLTVDNSTLSSNNGGGILNWGTLTVNNSTLSSNASGGIINDGMLTISNSTLSGNVSSSQGSGIRSGGSLTLSNTIVAGNIATSGGVKPLSVEDTIPGKEIYSREAVRFTSLGHNLFGENGADGLVNAPRAASDLVLAGAIATAIGPLASNGGSTQTHLPVPGSPAIDAGDNTLALGRGITNQRGAGFPRIVNDRADIGAVEVQPPPSLVSGLSKAGQIYFTSVISPPTTNREPLVGDELDSANASLSTWGSLPGQLARLSVGDFNGDGEGDLAGVASNGTIWYTTERGAWIQVPGGLSQISVGDFTGAGQDGLAGLASDGSIWYSTTLSGWTRVSGQLAHLQVGDLNGDGRDDLAGIAANGSVWYSTNLTTWNRVPGALAQLQVGDLNGDGKDDLAGIAANGSVWYSTTLTNWNQAPGTLAQLQVGDLNGDGQADLAGIAANGSVWYSTTLSGWTQLPGTLSQLVTSDLNGDGRVDLSGLAANGTIWYSTDLTGWVNQPGQLAQLARH